MPLAVNNNGTVLGGANQNPGEPKSVDLAKLQNYGRPISGYQPPQGLYGAELLDNADEVIGVEGGGAAGIGAVWNGDTGSETTQLVSLPSGGVCPSCGNVPYAITPDGHIFGTSLGVAAVWNGSTAVPQQLVGVNGTPLYVSGDGSYLVTGNYNGSGKPPVYNLYHSGAQHADQLTVSVSTPSDNGGTAPQLGDTVPVTVTVSTPATNAATVTNIAFNGQPLQWTPATGLTLVDGPTPTPPSPWGLAPGATQSFTFHVKAKQTGPITLSSHLSGSDSNGNSISATGEDTITPQGGVTITSGNQVAEPASGSVPATFTISLPQASTTPVTIGYKTADGTAKAANHDYTAIPNGSITIPARTPRVDVQVQVDGGSGNSTTGTKDFQVQLTSSSGSPISSTAGSAAQTIILPGVGGTLTGGTGKPQASNPVTLTGIAGTGQAVTQSTITDTNGK